MKDTNPIYLDEKAPDDNLIVIYVDVYLVISYGNKMISSV